MMPELIERTQKGSETYERYKLPCGTMLQKTTTPNPKSVTPSARYKLRGRYATNKTVDQLLAKIEGLSDDPAHRDESRHMSAHFVARALMHRAARNPATMQQLSDEANTAWNKARAAAVTASAAAEAAAQPAQEPEPEPRRQDLAQIAMRWTDVLIAYGFSTGWMWNDGRAPDDAIAVVQCDRAVAGRKEKGAVEIHRGGFTRFLRGGLQVTHEEFTQWVQTPVPKEQPKLAPQQELQTTVRLDIPQDDAQPTLVALRTLLAAACGEPAPAQALAQAVRVGMVLQQQLEEQLK